MRLRGKVKVEPQIVMVRVLDAETGEWTSLGRFDGGPIVKMKARYRIWRWNRRKK